MENGRKVMFLQHSGAAVVIEDTALIFDCEDGRVPEELQKTSAQVFFVSHGHPDHFSRRIFRYGVGKRNVAYVLSDDITSAPFWKHLHTDRLRVTEAAPGNHYRVKIGGAVLHIRTLRSTDLGVAYLVTYRGVTIYHAGDLNCWSWTGLSTKEQEEERRAYRKEIDQISNEDIDIAFVLLDPRLEDNYGEGMDYFLKQTRATRVFPIHMWNKFNLIAAYKKGLSEEDAERIAEIRENGQVFLLDEEQTDAEQEDKEQ